MGAALTIKSHKHAIPLPYAGVTQIRFKGSIFHLSAFPCSPSRIVIKLVSSYKYNPLKPHKSNY